jgi:hypothetical protein
VIVLEAGQTIRGVAGNASSINYHIMGMELVGGVETYKTLATGQLTASITTLYTAPASTEVLVKSITLVNINVNLRTGVGLFVGGSAASNRITGSLSFTPYGMAVLTDAGWSFYDLIGQRKVRG